MTETAPSYDTTSAAHEILLDSIVESPTNPRRSHNATKDDELAESVSKLGVLQAVLVRPVERGYELVFGHRRLRAARKAGLETIPAICRQLSDLEVLEAQLVENTQRADVEPLEEARAYKRLHTDYGRGVDEIAAKVGKSRAHVYGRLKLLELCAPGQKAIETGALDATVGLLVARIPSEKLQREALDRLRGYKGDPVSYRHAREVIQDEFMLRLKDAPFSPGDAELVPAAGPCTTCPKRTGNQTELFADVQSADICTDPPCYQKKVDTAWKVRAIAARKSGQEVLEGKAAERASYSSDFVRLDEICYEDGKSRKYSQLLGKDAPPTILLRTEHGDVCELVRRADVTKILREKGISTRRDESYRTGRTPAREFARKRELELERLVLEQLADRGPKLVTSGKVEVWRWLARAAVESAWHDSLKGIVARREIDRADKRSTLGHSAAVIRWIQTSDVAACQGLLVEVLSSRHTQSLHGRNPYEDEYSPIGARLGAEVAGIDLDTLRKTIKSEQDAKQKERKAAAKARTKVAATAKKLAKASRAREAELARVVGELHGCRPKKKAAKASKKVQTCRSCGCTDADCSQCIEKTGEPCTWVKKDLCSACVDDA